MGLKEEAGVGGGGAGQQAAGPGRGEEGGVGTSMGWSAGRSGSPRQVARSASPAQPGRGNPASPVSLQPAPGHVMCGGLLPPLAQGREHSTHLTYMPGIPVHGAQAYRRPRPRISTAYTMSVYSVPAPLFLLGWILPTCTKQNLAASSSPLLHTLSFLCTLTFTSQGLMGTDSCADAGRILERYFYLLGG